MQNILAVQKRKWNFMQHTHIYIDRERDNSDMKKVWIHELITRSPARTEESLCNHQLSKCSRFGHYFSAADFCFETFKHDPIFLSRKRNPQCHPLA